MGTKTLDTELIEAPEIQPSLDKETREQSRMLDEDMPNYIEEYKGKFIVYSNHQVLSSGDNFVAAIRGLSNKERKLPLVVRQIPYDAESLDSGGHGTL